MFAIISSLHQSLAETGRKRSVHSNWSLLYLPSCNRGCMTVFCSLGLWWFWLQLSLDSQALFRFPESLQKMRLVKLFLFFFCSDGFFTISCRCSSASHHSCTQREMVLWCTRVLRLWCGWVSPVSSYKQVRCCCIIHLTGSAMFLACISHYRWFRWGCSAPTQTFVQHVGPHCLVYIQPRECCYHPDPLADCEQSIHPPIHPSSTLCPLPGLWGLDPNLSCLIQRETTTHTYRSH